MSAGPWLMGGSNLIENYGFEEGDTSSWDAVGGNSFWADATNPLAGTYCGALYVEHVMGTEEVYQRGFSLIAGQDYFLRFAIKRSNTYVRSLVVTIEDYGLSSNLGLEDRIDYSEFDTSSWTYFGYGFTASETGSAAVRFKLLASGGDGTESVILYMDQITIFPAARLGGNYDYKTVRTVPRVDNVTRTGALHTYIVPGAFRSFEVPAIMVNSSGRCTINSFWAVGSYCYFVENAEAVNSIYKVDIVGNEEPLQTFVTPHGRVYLRGSVKLETHSAN